MKLKNNGNVKTSPDNYTTSFIPVTLSHNVQYYYILFITCETTLNLLRYIILYLIYLNYGILSLIIFNIIPEQVVSEGNKKKNILHIRMHTIYTFTHTHTHIYSIYT